MPLSPQFVRLLLLEDNPDDVFLFKAALKRLKDIKFQVMEANRLVEAIAILRQQTFDIAITDLNLPDSVGLSTLKKLIEHANGIPVIALTGWEDPVLGAELVKEGAVCYWSKDRLNGVDLAASILKAVTQRRML